MHSRQVFQDEYFTVLVDDRTGIVRTIRSATPYASLDVLEGLFARLGGILDGLGRSRYMLLADIREAPGRNDPEFEAISERLRPLWIGGFPRVGVLVRTSVGLMQIQRHARRDGLRRLISQDEGELLRYLTGND